MNEQKEELLNRLFYLSQQAQDIDIEIAYALLALCTCMMKRDKQYQQFINLSVAIVDNFVGEQGTK